MTLISSAKRGIITEEMKKVAIKERVSPEFIRDGIADGRIVITKNAGRNIEPIGIGEGLFIKINANIGSSRYIFNLENELEKARIAVKYGADTLMDLSTGRTESDLKEIRSKVLKEISIPLGTVPIYQSALRALEKRGAIINMNEDDIFKVIEEQAKEGVDFFTVHVGITRHTVEHLKNHKRELGIVSRGGTFLASWILRNKEENPLIKNYDYLLEIAKEYDVCLSLGDGMRPGCIFDANDYAQMSELLEISRLLKRAKSADVQVIVEGPGHMPADQIAPAVQLQKRICEHAPFYVLGPLVTDIAPGYDHLVGAIGGVIAGLAGVDYLCYVTPNEHLALPDGDAVRDGVIASKIAAHAIDLVKRPMFAGEWDMKMDKARDALDWNEMIRCSIDPEKARYIHEKNKPYQTDKPCTMCGDLCAIKLLKESFESDPK